jgi:hypothetical protein
MYDMKKDDVQDVHLRIDTLNLIDHYLSLFHPHIPFFHCRCEVHIPFLHIIFLCIPPSHISHGNSMWNVEVLSPLHTPRSLHPQILCI